MLSRFYRCTKVAILMIWIFSMWIFMLWLQSFVSISHAAACAKCSWGIQTSNTIAPAVVKTMGIKAILINTYERKNWVWITLVNYVNKYSILRNGWNNILISNTRYLQRVVKTVDIRLDRSIYCRNIYWYTKMGSHLTVIFVRTRTIAKMVSIVTSRKNMKD